MYKFDNDYNHIIEYIIKINIMIKKKYLRWN